MFSKITQSVQEHGTSIPPPVVAGLTLFGVPLSDWVLIATLVYTLILIINNLETLYRKVQKWCNRDSKD